MKPNGVELCFGLIYLVGVLCQKKPLFTVSVSKISGTGFKEKNLTVTTEINNRIKKATTSNYLICPEKRSFFPLFPFPCDTNEDCLLMGPKMVCCDNRCLKGVLPSSINATSSIPKVQNKFQADVQSTSEKYSRPEIFINLITTTQKAKVTTEKAADVTQKNSNLVCPANGSLIFLYSLPCSKDKDCSIMGSKMICCSKKCIRGEFQTRPDSTTISVSRGETAVRKREGDTSGNTINNFPETIVEPTKLPPVTIVDNLPDHSILVCPGKDVRLPLFSLPCSINKDCTIGVNMVCCSNRCIKGVPPPKPEIQHSPSWFGLIQRQCPTDPIAEILQIRECESDSDCAPRICCPDTHSKSGNTKNFCRTAQPSFERFPVADRLMEPLRVFTSYLQCTPPPPGVLDLFPKACNNSLDCFPNLCCQEGGKKYCRPPKRSLLSFVAGVGQRIIPTNAARRLIERLN